MKINSPEPWGLFIKNPEKCFLSFDAEKVGYENLKFCLKYEIARESETLRKKAVSGSLIKYGAEYDPDYFPSTNWCDLIKKRIQKKYPLWNKTPSKSSPFLHIKNCVFTRHPEYRQKIDSCLAFNERQIDSDGKEVIILEIDWKQYYSMPDALQKLLPKEINPKKRTGRIKGSAQQDLTYLKQLMATRLQHKREINQIPKNQKPYRGENYIRDWKHARETVKTLLHDLWKGEIYSKEIPMSYVSHEGNKSLFK